MSDYYTVRDAVMDTLSYLESKVDYTVWNIVEHRLNEFLGGVNDVIDMYADDTELIEDGWIELRLYLDILEGQILGIETIDVNVDQDKLDSDINTIIDTIDSRIGVHLLPESSQLDRVADLFFDYIEHNNRQIENNSWTILRDILDGWYNNQSSHGEDLEHIDSRVQEFIAEVSDHIQILVDDTERLNEIESYMSDYNDRLFDVISGRNTESDTIRNVESLSEPYIELLADMRWRSDPDPSPTSIESQLRNIRDVKPELYQLILSSGIELDDIVKNFSSISVNETMKRDLQLLLNR